MQEDTVVGLPRPGGMVEDDPLLTVLREGARQMLTHAIEAELAAFLALHADEVDEEGRRRLVRHGHAPKRTIQTGIGGIEVQRPRVRDRSAGDVARIRFTSAVLPAYLRRAKNIEELLPWRYLEGVSGPVRGRARGSPGPTCTCGRTASTSHPGSSTRGNASWS